MTRIGELGEFGLLERLTKDIKPGHGVVKGIGDDCAVLENGSYYELVTTDMLVSGDHFRCDWHSPRQIGWKSIVVNISDIASMGGLPDHALVSMALPDDTEVEFMEDVFQGMKEACKVHDVTIIGGDTTHGSEMVINVAILGHVEKEMLCLRSDAKVGDLTCLTGDLGKSWAGLELLKAGKTGHTDFYLQPSCRLDVARKLAPFVNAMIDVSDGLASEVNHICRESGVGAEIISEKIPISEKTAEAAASVGKDPLKWALSGGEDFEMLYTVSKENYEKIRSTYPTIIGSIIEEGIYLFDGERKSLKGGYDHFHRV